MLARRRGREDDADLLGTLAVAVLLVLLPLAIVMVLKLIPAEVMAESRAKAAEAAARPGHGATAVIVLIWIAALGVTGWFAYRCFGA